MVETACPIDLTADTGSCRNRSADHVEDVVAFVERLKDVHGNGAKV
jgi:hypothetical protein